jgi:hypothetical protein
VNHTYQPKDYSTTANIPRIEYQLRASYYFTTPNTTFGTLGYSWRPIEALKVLDSDVYVFFMSAPGIYYSAPVTDPWFSAQRRINRTTSIKEKTDSFWQQDEPLGVKGCIQQV